MCAYISPVDPSRVLHFSAYAMWRLNWIHPFADGNGRTARALSYLVLCVGLLRLLPGEMTIPERIARNKYPYWDALGAADRAWKAGWLDVGEMEDLIQALAIQQLREGR
jgi:hypothetical protein